MYLEILLANFITIFKPRYFKTFLLQSGIYVLAVNIVKHLQRSFVEYIKYTEKTMVDYLLLT